MSNKDPSLVWLEQATAHDGQFNVFRTEEDDVRQFKVTVEEVDIDV